MKNKKKLRSALKSLFKGPCNVSAKKKQDAVAPAPKSQQHQTNTWPGKVLAKKKLDVVASPSTRRKPQTKTMTASKSRNPKSVNTVSKLKALPSAKQPPITKKSNASKKKAHLTSDKPPVKHTIGSTTKNTATSKRPPNHERIQRRNASPSSIEPKTQRKNLKQPSTAAKKEKEIVKRRGAFVISQSKAFLPNRIDATGKVKTVHKQLSIPAHEDVSTTESSDDEYTEIEITSDDEEEWWEEIVLEDDDDEVSWIEEIVEDDGAVIENSWDHHY